MVIDAGNRYFVELLSRLVCQLTISFHTFLGERMMLVLPNQLLCLVLSTSDQCFVSFQPILCHPHTQTRIALFHDVQRDIPNLEFSPNHASIGFSQIAFPIPVLPKDYHTDFAQEERLGLPYWTMILEVSVILEHLTSLSEFKQILRPLLVLSIPAVWR